MRIHYSIDAMVADQTIKALFACSLFEVGMKQNHRQG